MDATPVENLTKRIEILKEAVLLQHLFLFSESHKEN